MKALRCITSLVYLFPAVGEKISVAYFPQENHSYYTHYKHLQGIVDRDSLIGQLETGCYSIITQLKVENGVYLFSTIFVKQYDIIIPLLIVTIIMTLGALALFINLIMPMIRKDYTSK